jgi:hypothetical protein
MDAKDINYLLEWCHLKWWRKHEAMFPIVGFGWTNIECWFQIEIDNFFSIVNMLTNLRRF